MQDEIFNMLMKEDDITWQNILTELVRSEKMDPWDIDVSLLTKKYIEMLKKLKELDLNISGKVVLCAAILLKMKSRKLMGADLERLDQLFAGSEEDEFDFDDEEYDPYEHARKVLDEGDIKLIPRTPQPRQRKVSIYDLMEALQKAMEVKKRRVMRDVPEEIDLTIPEKKIDISVVIRETLGRIKSWFFKNKQKLTFSQLVPGQTKEDKIYTFIPLLHLATQRKIDIGQQEHFGEIDISLAKEKTDDNPEDKVEDTKVDENNKIDEEINEIDEKMNDDGNNEDDNIE